MYVTMKKIFIKSKKAISVAIIGVVTTMAVLTATAQPNPGGPGTLGSGVKADGQPIDGASVPFDGGMSMMLLASGIGYGAKRLRRK